MISRMAADQFFRILDRAPEGRFRISCPDGKVRELGSGQNGSVAELSIEDWSVFRSALQKGELGLVESYRQGLWSTPDLTNVLVTGMQNAESLISLIRGGFLTRAASRALYAMRANSVRGSRKNIQAHYDLGNDFYQLWLDPSMSYSSALYQGDADISLEQAQMNKYDRMLDLLQCDQGSLLEIGCGWAGFAERALERGDFDYRGITLSEEQKAFADSRLDSRDQVVLQDYRHQEGKYKNIVSIEMFEAVGEKYWPLYFAKLKSLLAEGGKAAIQSITIKNESFEKYRSRGDMFRTYIFPGGMLPSPQRFSEEAERAGLRLTDQFDFGQDYAKTVETWLQNFEDNIDQVRAQNYDESFIRLWRFYLAACIAGFKSGNTGVMQVQLTHA